MLEQHDFHTILTFMGEDWKIAEIDWANCGPFFRLRNHKHETIMYGGQIDWDAYNEACRYFPGHK